MFNRKGIIFLFSVMAVVAGSFWTVKACYSSPIVAPPAEKPAAVSTPAAEYKVIGKFRDTFYYVVQESDYSSRTKDTSVRDMNDEVLATVSKAFKSAMDIEGTGKLADGRVINYAGVKDKEIRYQVTVHSYGRGVGNCELVPFYSVAMDKREVALGSVIYIDETLNMKLPDGTLHNGYWRVDDVGGAIKKDRIDLFVGTSDWGRYLSMAKIDHLQPLTVRLVSAPATNSCVHDTPQ